MVRFLFFVQTILFFIVPQFCISQALIWPTIGPSQEISQNYGAMQSTGYIFHNAIDIPGIGGTSVIYAVKPGKIIDVWHNTAMTSFTLYVETQGNSNEIIGYTHIEEDISKLQIINNGIVVCINITIAANDELGLMSDKVTANTSHDHLHLSVQSDAPSETSQKEETRLNPLIELYPSFNGGVAPELGPMFVRKPNELFYQQYEEINFLYGKNRISREIIDHLNGEFIQGASQIDDDDIWPTVPVFTQRYNGFTSVPIRIEFGIENDLRENVYPSSSTGFIKFDENPNQYNMLALYDNAKSAFSSVDTDRKYYCFWLTNLNQG